MSADMMSDDLRIALEEVKVSRAKLWGACLDCVGDEFEGCYNGEIWGPCSCEYCPGLCEKKGSCPCRCHKQLEPGPTQVTGLADETECPSDHMPCDLPCIICGAQV